MICAPWLKPRVGPYDVTSQPLASQRPRSPLTLMQTMEHRSSCLGSRPVDRAAMIEAASRSLRQQMGRNRDNRPRSKGSLHDVRGEAARASGGGAGGGGGGGGAEPEPRSAENAQRRIRSAENEHRFVHSGTMPREAPHVVSSPSSALYSYPADEEAGQGPGGHPGLEDVAHLGELKRPLSRKKDPSASAAAGLGAFSSPVKMTDAFEQRKTRHPIPVESWGPRPPSRHGLPTKAVPLEASLDQEPNIIIASSSRNRGEGIGVSSSGVVGGTWAAARSPIETRRGRERKAKDRSSPDTDLGISGCGTLGTRSPSGQMLSKSFSSVFDQSSPLRGGDREAAVASRQGTAGTSWAGGAPWAAHVDAGGALEVSGCGLGDGFVAAGGPQPWPGSPAGSCGGQASPPTRKGARHSETVSVEDVDADFDIGLHHLYRRDATPPQVIVTRSTMQRKERGENPRRERERSGSGKQSQQQGEEQARATERQKSMPFCTSLDSDFLSLFAA